MLAGRDVLAGAQTGTGKTAAFVLPILQNLGAPQGGAPRALVLTPTRELAAQVAASAQDYGRFVDLRTVVIFGGVSERPQIEALRRGCDILVATPGRLLDLAQQGVLKLNEVRVCVLDEADRMLDMGFIPAIRRIQRMLPGTPDPVLGDLFEDIRALAAHAHRTPVAIEVAARATADRIEARLSRAEGSKAAPAGAPHRGRNWQQVLVFTRTKHGANGSRSRSRAAASVRRRFTATRARRPCARTPASSRGV